MRHTIVAEPASFTGVYLEHGIKSRSSTQTYDVAPRRALEGRVVALRAALD